MNSVQERAELFDKVWELVMERYGEVFCRLTESDYQPAPSDSCKTPDGKCDGTCEGCQ